MLIQFRFKNFKSFKDDAILDLSATKITEHASRVIQVGKEKLLPVAAIYGANASGKSNVIEAFRFMMTYVLDSFNYGGEVENKRTKEKKLKKTPFLFDKDSRNKESSFEVYFIEPEDRGGKSYNYGFTLNQNGVVEEWLNTKAKTARDFKKFFYRSGDELDLCGLPAASQDNIRVALEKEALIVSLGAKLKIAKLKMVRNWFYDNTVTNFGDPIENVFLSRFVPGGFIHDKNVQENVADYLSMFDSSILGFHVEVQDENTDMEQVDVSTLHRMIDSDEVVRLPLEEESDGTLKMFTLYPMLLDALELGSTLWVDELNARLHPLLVRNILLMFLNTKINTKHAQLIFTTHDAWQLSNHLLRRDEIWFTEKAANGVSSLYSLADFMDEDGTKIRKDESYEKNYLLGKYGAIPTLKCFDMFKEEA
ncbi:ATP-binding protein [Clostridium sp. D33t1_170424_F3]|uniref:AAA family ATPase n=1 Tax=Clostridium sp. D33t1_170424_F3 TaxID=2787099 RepID=UPI0018AC7C40|nr:ATP-binding protein [Clostridium sp. D33t1_170424_F3]